MALITSVISAPLCDKCDRNSAESDIGYTRSKRSTVATALTCMLVVVYSDYFTFLLLSLKKILQLIKKP